MFTRIVVTCTDSKQLLLRTIFYYATIVILQGLFFQDQPPPYKSHLPPTTEPAISGYLEKCLGNGLACFLSFGVRC